MLIAVAVRVKHVKREVEVFASKLVEWYKVNKREFPWRVGMGDEWRVALTGILLRKTRAETVAKHYERVMSSLSTPERAVELGVKGIEELLRPLGLHRTRARQIYELAKAWRSGGHLPGVGPYALSLIDCLARGKLVPVVDVNTARVVKRVFGVGSLEEVKELLQKAVLSAGTCELNLALMDFAAGICTAWKPRCESCFLRDTCAYAAALAKRV